MRVNLGTKLLVINLGPVLVISLIWGLYVPKLQSRLLERGLQTKVESLGNLLVRNIGPDLALGDQKAAAEGLGNVQDDADFQFAVLLKDDGSVFATSGDLAAYRRLAAAGPLKGAGRSGALVTQAFPVQMQGKTIGTVILGMRRIDDATTAESLFQMLIVPLLLMAMGAGLGLFSSARLARPLVMMTRVTSRLAEGDIQQTVDFTSDDELGTLADALRALIGYVQGVAAAADALSRGDLTLRIAPKSEQDVLSRNFLRAAAALRELLEQTQGLIAAAQGGELGRRGNADALQGAYADLIHGVNRMTDAMLAPIEEASSALERLAKRDMTVRVNGTYKGDYAKMARALNTAAANLGEGLSQVASVADQVSSASGQIAESSQALANGASRQAASIEQTASALKELASKTRENAENASSASGRAHEAEIASNAGVAAMSQMTAAMARIRSSSEGTMAIIQDINEIAFQTNLLALNAAVEAARAGDAGRGFGVVAEEVRNLALRSKEAAKKTESLLKESTSLAHQGEGISQEVSKNLSQIVASVGIVTETMKRIAEASESQARGIGAMHQAVTQIDQVTQKNAAGAEQSASSSQVLSAQATLMRELVGQFHLHEAGGKTNGVSNGRRQQLAGDGAEPRNSLVLTDSEASDF